MTDLALHQITMFEVEPLDIIPVAASLGCKTVCVIGYLPPAITPDGTPTPYAPSVNRKNKGAVMSRLKGHGMDIGHLEFFPITPTADLERYREVFALGGEIGAKRVVCHVHDAEEQRAVDMLGRVADLAAEHGLNIGLEFVGMMPACNSLVRAAWFVEQVGRKNVGIGIDALHWVRSGGTADQIRALPPHYFEYAQICDGHGLHQSNDYVPEALDREVPGAGDFPLEEFLAALPVTVPIDVEVPSARLQQAGVAPADRAREAVVRSRELIHRVRGGQG